MYNPEIAILRKGMISLYHDNKVLNEDIEWFRETGYKVYFIELDKIESTESFHEYISRVLEFETGYGKNMSAFEDSLADLKLDGSIGALLVLSKYDAFIKKFPNLAFEVLDIIAETSRLYLVDGIKLITLVQMDDTNLSLPKVGGYYIDSNSREGIATN